MAHVGRIGQDILRKSAVHGITRGSAVSCTTSPTRRRNSCSIRRPCAARERPHGRLP
jgi:hypothetical protein